MNSLPATVGDFYRYVVGVDTHAATHSYAIIEAPNGGLIDQNVFPTSPAGLRRAREWIARRTERSEEHTSELQSRGHLVCRLLLEKKKIMRRIRRSITIIVSFSNL